MTRYNYKPPVDRLLTYGDCREIHHWPNYLESGFTDVHIPELIRMATDPELNMAYSDTQEVWAPVHAWRTLGQLKAEDAIEPLIGMLKHIDEDDADWVNEELPKVLGMIGLSTLPLLKKYATDTTNHFYARIAALRSIREIATNHVYTRDECVTFLSSQLKNFQENDASFNGFLIGYLMDLKAIESSMLIQQAFQANCVDETIAGDWEDVQVEYGLIEERNTPPEYGLHKYLETSKSPLDPKRPLSKYGNTSNHNRAMLKERNKARNRRKLASKARKQIRKRR
jgi:hypothetical protein